MAVSTASAPRRKRRDSERRLAFWLLLPAILAVFGVILYPLGRTLLISLFEVTSAVAVDTPFVGLGNYIEALSANGFWGALGRTLYFTLVSTSIELVFGLGIAFLLNAKIRGRWILRALVVLPWAVPTIVNAAMWKGIYNAQYGALNGVLSHLGVIDSYQAWLSDPTTALNLVIIADAWKTTPLVAIFLLAGLTSIPSELTEAAKVDRAGAFRRFFSITLPLLLPSVALVLVLRTVEAVKVFDIIYAMTRGGPANGTQTISYYTYVTAFSEQNYGLGSAISFLVLIIILVLTTAYLRMLRRSEMSTL
ncbi:sugar ABC transporter permease [Leucobacter sp. USCH14]|uniref:ABC transporter permease n=1 Tax=Leucobacter chromiiresistens TaxID=1079994 RepID=A0A147ENU0_9MICO|nr:sugar ABC transporter permease [Leucobacter chromiiresistens]KTR86152.1 ABC transporter permease [Leucobacter chromiiresistens]